MQPLDSKYAPFLFHQLSPNSARIQSFKEIYIPDQIQIQQNLL